MALYDLPLDELRAYTPERVEPPDLDGFWRRTLADADGAATEPVAVAVPGVPVWVEAFDLTFSGYGGDPVRAWLVLPAGTGQGGSAHSRVGGVVQLAGYSGGRGEVADHLGWAGMGLAVLVMDSRGQGWTSAGATGDPHGVPGPSMPGLMTRGIGSAETLYHRRLITDAVRAVTTLQAWPGVDGTRVGVSGGSQGGGLAIAAAALAEGVAAAVIDVPFLCHFRRAVRMTDSPPYREIRDYLAVYRDRVESVFSVLDHVDGVNLAARGTCPALFSVALMDLTCPPSTVFAAYNHWAGSKDIGVYEFNGHEGGGPLHAARARQFLVDHLAGVPAGV